MHYIEIDKKTRNIAFLDEDILVEKSNAEKYELIDAIASFHLFHSFPDWIIKKVMKHGHTLWQIFLWENNMLCHEMNGCKYYLKLTELQLILHLFLWTELYVYIDREIR